MNSLVVYYSRTGITKKVATAIAGTLDCDSEEIFDTKNRDGPIGYIGAGKDASRKKLTKLRGVTKDPGSYDIIIIGTPIWAWTISTPIRTYISQYSNKFKKVAFFCTYASNKGSTFDDMEELSSKRPISTLEITKKDLKSGIEAQKVQNFIKEIINQN